MILSLYNLDQPPVIPHTSTCIVHTTGTINDGDEIIVSSPLFSSQVFQSYATILSDKFKVKIRILNESKSIVINNDETIQATLVCDDNNVFDMYVRVY